MSYSHDENRSLVDLLLKHLLVAERAGLLEVFWDARIAGGEHWHAKIREAIAASDVALFLISVDSLNSKFLNDHEIPCLLQYEAQGLKLLPVLLRPCPWTFCRWLEERQVIMDHGEALGSGPQEQVEARFAALTRTVVEAAFGDFEPDPSGEGAGTPSSEGSPPNGTKLKGQDEVRRKAGPRGERRLPADVYLPGSARWLGGNDGAASSAWERTWAQLLPGLARGGWLGASLVPRPL